METMGTIEDWLRDHPMISLNGIERELGITHGTLRKGKDIPKKYRGEVERVLRGYGYGKDNVIKTK